MSRRYQDSGFPVAAVFIVILAVAVVGLTLAFLNVSGKASKAEFDAKRASLLTDKLTAQVSTLSGQLGGSESRLRNEMAAQAQAAINDAKGSIVRTVEGGAAPGRTATFVVCASNAVATNQCDYVTDGSNDQTEINLALAALPAGGGEVRLTEGNFSINGVDGTFGGVLIQTSNVVLSGSGMGTKLTLTDGNTNKNVIRVIGNNLENVTIRDMWIDANRDKQRVPGGKTIFEADGIRASAPTSAVDALHPRNIVVENTRIENCSDLCILLYGTGVFIRNNWIGNAYADTVELLGGPGEIANNHFEITGITGVVISVDAGNDINLINNTIDVKDGGSVETAIRSWQGFSGINIQNNVITAAGPIANVIRSASSHSLISGNIIRPWDGAPNPGLLITAGTTTLSDNLIANTDIVLNDTEATGEVVIRDNILDGVTITNTAGKLKVSHNTGYTTESSGTATVANGATAVVVNHGMVAAPTRVQLTPSNNPANAIAWYWISNLTATQFTINVNTNPGATGVIFSWRATVGAE
ncbi:MAG: hypothetical protein Q7K03_04015 [Dehalococcoidia bacterium]|nr:hypothetical protein [Dehalococcoidia bacterium]